MAMNFFTAKHELIALAISTLGGTYGGVCVHAFQIWEGRQISGQCSSAVESDLRDSGRIRPEAVTATVILEGSRTVLAHIENFRVDPTSLKEAMDVV
ncbi:hypothetical protein Plhal703r1_c59g0164761 [Plasmopara halstedii]